MLLQWESWKNCGQWLFKQNLSFCLHLFYRVRSHIVHLSAASALPMIREAQAAGAPLTVETCHHYLTLDSESVPDGKTEYKCCPPIRDKSNQVRD